MISLFLTLVAGALATALMTLSLYGFAFIAKTRMDLFATLSRVLTGNRSDGPGVGIALHFLTGGIAALLYVGVWSIFGFKGLPVLAGLGAFVGFAHGLVASQLLVALAGSEHQKSARLSLALPYFAAHLVYGVALGSIASLLELQWAFVTPVL